MRSRARFACGKDMREGNWAEIGDVGGIDCVGVVKSCPGGDSDANSGRSDAALVVGGAELFAHSMRGEKPSQKLP